MNDGSIPDLKRSFIFLPGVGSATERRIWKSGVPDWETFLGVKKAGPISEDRKIEMDNIIRNNISKLNQGDLFHFSQLFQGSDSWRLWNTFSEGAVYLDIETTGTRKGTLR